MSDDEKTDWQHIRGKACSDKSNYISEIITFWKKVLFWSLTAEGLSSGTRWIFVNVPKNTWKWSLFDIVIQRESCHSTFHTSKKPLKMPKATVYEKITPVVSHCFCLWHTVTLNIRNSVQLICLPQFSWNGSLKRRMRLIGRIKTSETSACWNQIRLVLSSLLFNSWEIW